MSCWEKLSLACLQGLAARTDAKIVVVLIHGGPLAVEWLQKSTRISAILTAWMPGQVRKCATSPCYFEFFLDPAGKGVNERLRWIDAS